MISVPGKIFIFGEYSVMAGGEAILAAVSPSFECTWNNTSKLHPDSPAGRFLTENKVQMSIVAANGLGAGFGSSTAELIAANACVDQPWSGERLWAWYHEHFSPASGADLAAQYASAQEGNGFYHFQLAESRYRMSRIEMPKDFLENCIVYQAPVSEKIPTHQELEKRKNQPIDGEASSPYVQKFLQLFDPAILTEWAESLAAAGCESAFAREVRLGFQAITGVRGVKGCGAGLNDVFLVCIDHTPSQKLPSELQAVAEKHKLKPLGKLVDHV